MLNPFKNVIVYPRFIDKGWSSYSNMPLKHNKLFNYQWYAYRKKGINLNNPDSYKTKVWKKLDKICIIKKRQRYDGKMSILCYSKQDESFIGSLFDVFKYCYYYGIRDFYKAHPHRKVASVGFAPKKERWYGWSHRAICSFGVGDEIKYDDDLLILSHGWIEGCPEYEEEKKQIQYVKSMFNEGILKIENLQQARFLAIRFADSIA